VRVSEALAELATGALRRIALSHALATDEAITRAQLIDRLAERLADPFYLRELIGALSPDEHAALVAARAAGGEVRGFLLDRDQPGAAAALVDRGLLFRTFAAAGPRRGEVFALADELMEVLPTPPASEPPPTEAGWVPSERRASDPAFSLFALASTLQRGQANLEEEVRGWSEEPGGWEWSARWAFFRQLSVASGVLIAHGHGALAAGPGLARLLNDPPRLSERLWRGYRDLRGWSELAEIGIDHPEDAADASLVRAAVIEAVERLPEGSWIGVHAFSDWLRESSPDLVREQLDARGRLLLERLDWEALELPLLRLIVLGPLYWLGKVASSVDGQHFARRAAARTPIAEAAYWEGMAEQSPQAEHSPPVEQSPLVEHSPPVEQSPLVEHSPPVEQSPLVEHSPPVEQSPLVEQSPPVKQSPLVEPSVPAQPAARGRAELIAPARADLGTLLEAERYLVLEQRGRLSRYRLVQQHVAAALGSGGSIEECRRLLRRLTHAARLPERIEERLALWSERFGAISVRPSVVIEARTQEELEAALAEEMVRPFVRRRLGPTAAEVTAADALQLAAALRESGHLPRVDAALRLGAEPRHSYPGLVDEQVLEFLLVSLLAFQRARPERLAELEGALSLVERLERQFSPERLRELRGSAEALAGELRTGPAPAPPMRGPRRARRPAARRPAGTV
jgi:hypothetical protein